MKVVCCCEFGRPDTLERIEADNPIAKSHQAVIDVSAAGVGFVDGLMVPAPVQNRPMDDYQQAPTDQLAGSMVGKLVVTN